MPYIKQTDRIKYNELIKSIATQLKGMPVGDLNYVITSILVQMVKDQGMSYAFANGLMGVLSCVSYEFYRRALVPYEDKKIQENGDVY